MLCFTVLWRGVCRLSAPQCTVAFRKYLASSSKGFSQGWINAYINNLSLYGPSALVSFDLVGV
jgi:hypothetical protein